MTAARFADEARLKVGLFRGDRRRILDRDRANERGRVRLRLDLPDLRQGDYLLFLQDGRGHLDWELVRVRPG